MPFDMPKPNILFQKYVHFFWEEKILLIAVDVHINAFIVNAKI